MKISSKNFTCIQWCKQSKTVCVTIMTNLKCVFIFVALNVVVLSLPLPGTKRNQLQTTANSRSPLVHDYTVDLFECWKAVRSGKAMNEQKQTKCEKTVGVKTPSGVIATAKSITTISPKNGENSYLAKKAFNY